MNLPPVGKHRTAPLRMFQAVAANKVRQNRYAVEDTAVCMTCVATQYLLGYAIGLMGCKNITTPVASDGDRRANPGLPRSGVRYRILKVAPLARRRGSSMSDDAGEALPLALHGVRGHFADYRDGRGLFGKHRGLYYINQHLRGKAEAGEVVKDYSVAGAPTP